MKRATILKVLILIIGAVLLYGMISYSQSIETRSGERVTIDGNFDDMVFAAGGKVTLDLSTPDDVFAAGGDINADRIEADHVTLAGGDIVLSQLKIDDLIVAGGNIVLIDGEIRDDVIAAGADVTLRETLSISGSAVLSGAEVQIQSPIAGDLKLAGDTVEINCVVGGQAELRAPTIIIGPKARIAGDLRYYSDNLTVTDGAIIAGETIKLERAPEQYFQPVLQRAYVVFALFSVLIIFGLIILVLAAVVALPALMNKARRRLNEGPLATLGIGFLIAIAGPALIGLLFVTGFGIPLALVIGAFYITFAPIALAAAIYATGGHMRNLIKRTDTHPQPKLSSRLGWTTLAAISFLIVGIIPILGGLVWSIAFIIGLGAVGTEIWIALAKGQSIEAGQISA